MICKFAHFFPYHNKYIFLMVKFFVAQKKFTHTKRFGNIHYIYLRCMLLFIPKKSILNDTLFYVTYDLLYTKF